ncbi:MAG TPA: hypothetical protein PLN27_17295 [Acidobacteriota bacterium]|jgi:hypothetical protein|nr:hypothetical protein [Acidobacteriota bacterium]
MKAFHLVFFAVFFGVYIILLIVLFGCSHADGRSKNKKYRFFSQHGN